MWPWHTVEGEEDACEVDVIVEVVARSRQAVGDTIWISDRARENLAAAA